MFSATIAHSTMHRNNLNNKTSFSQYSCIISIRTAKCDNIPQKPNLASENSKVETNTIDSPCNDVLKAIGQSKDRQNPKIDFSESVRLDSISYSKNVHPKLLSMMLSYWI